MEQWATQGNERRLLSSNCSRRSRYPFLVIPTEAWRSGGTCVSADPSWRCSSTERIGAVSFSVLTQTRKPP
jgi:hypothetical protein